ncbi:acyl-CoA dehydrogenase C-terminal domain-containing protein [Algiphilus sp. NNCM1]|nr:acyl-CoA dehydrogenase C-terminal domain-containing protein [Algiphilus acroporae]
MADYRAPTRDMQFVLHEMLDVQTAFQKLQGCEEVDADLINQVLDEAAKFSSEVLAPLNQPGDAEGCHIDDAGNVTAPKGFRDAYQQYVEAGWPSLACTPDFGGQGLPEIVNNVLYEMLNSANQAWTMYPGLTHGAYACLAAHGTEAIQQTYLPKIVEGTWTGTMCLTESHCGTDLGLLRTKAEPNDDGSYRLSGSKIFISSGEHDLAENIVHLVLARLPDAPAGTKGISLFVVPKFLPDADGNPGERNGIRCGSIEHKMGIHGNATCVMNLDDAKGWLVGEPHKGLPAMFVMMNGARLGVGMQSLGLAEVAYQNAVTYARDRLQMRALSGPKAKDKPADPIIVHPDVRRMLLTQRAYTEAARAFCYWVGLMIDTEHRHGDEATRKECADLVALLTPVVKAFITDNTFETTNLALQCYGGHGYIQEWGMEQFVRDARINMIYEGTNGIQALDLIGRKVLGDGGARLRRLGAIIEAFIKEQNGRDDMKEFVEPLADIGGKLTKLTGELGQKAMQNPEEAGAASTDYLRVLGHTVYAYLWARMARVALDNRTDAEAAFYDAKLATARFYFARLLPETAYHIRAARSGVDNLMALTAEQF